MYALNLVRQLMVCSLLGVLPAIIVLSSNQIHAKEDPGQAGLYSILEGVNLPLGNRALSATFVRVEYHPAEASNPERAPSVRETTINKILVGRQGVREAIVQKRQSSRLRLRHTVSLEGGPLKESMYHLASNGEQIAIYDEKQAAGFRRTVSEYPDDAINPVSYLDAVFARTRFLSKSYHALTGCLRSAETTRARMEGDEFVLNGRLDEKHGGNSFRVRADPRRGWIVTSIVLYGERDEVLWALASKGIREVAAGVWLPERVTLETRQFPGGDGNQILTRHLDILDARLVHANADSFTLEFPEDAQRVYDANIGINMRQPLRTVLREIDKHAETIGGAATRTGQVVLNQQAQIVEETRRAYRDMLAGGGRAYQLDLPQPTGPGVYYRIGIGLGLIIAVGCLLRGLSGRRHLAGRLLRRLAPRRRV